MESFLDLIRFEAWRDAVVHWSGRLVGAIVLLLIGVWVARRIASLVRHALAKRGGDAALAGFIGNVASGAFVLVVLVGALDLAGVPTASSLAVLGAGGLAVALALKDSLANLASGVLLIVTRPFRAGDMVEAGGRVGTVQRIALLQTVLATTDNCDVFLPNGEVMAKPIVNFTARPQRRLELSISLAYEDDPTIALRVIQDTLAAHPQVLREPAPQILVLRLAESSIDVAVRPWVSTGEYWEAHSAILADLKAALGAAGVSIPYPHRVLRVVHEGDRDARPPAVDAD